MKRTPRISPSSFIVGSAAVGGGLALGLRFPFGPLEAHAAANTAPEVNAWVVIKPDDTVVIRIARSEMGQGTLTGLAQLVAEELECDWSKVTDRVPDARARASRASASGAISPPAAAAASASRTNMCARAAPPRAMMLVQAAANQWKVPARECIASNERHHAQAVRPQDHLRQGRGRGRAARAAEGRQAQGPEGLEDRRQAAEAARHREQGQRQAGLRRRPEAAGHAERGDQGMPGVRRQGQELRREQGRDA